MLEKYKNIYNITINNFKDIKKENAITLIVLVITIIILLILAGITISTVMKNGLFDKAKEVKEESIKAQIKEELQLAILSIQASNINDFNMETIIKNLPKENNLDLNKLEWNDTQQSKEPNGKYKGYQFYIDSNYEIRVENIKRTYLYNAGDECKELTGGWNIITLEEASYGSAKKEESYIDLKTWKKWCSYSVITEKEIDLSKFKKIYIEIFDLSVVHTGYESAYIDINMDKDWERPRIYLNNGINVLELNENSSQLIEVVANNGGSFKIRKIWLE